MVLKGNRSLHNAWLHQVGGSDPNTKRPYVMSYVMSVSGNALRAGNCLESFIGRLKDFNIILGLAEWLLTPSIIRSRTSSSVGVK